ncbi:hypothetical protein ACKC9G_18590 [Pokkaliibacter sp. CJK22405]|uniref:hypothetical protein n=1 Tax=Pokkaliibacter sp. CJK22405 TaxID=3384615 RepID=UPI0039852EC8
MRNPSRIPEVLGVIEKIWQKMPDVRFNQLVLNLLDEYNNQGHGVGNGFYLEDDRYLAYLQDYLKHLQEKEAAISTGTPHHLRSQ